MNDYNEKTLTDLVNLTPLLWQNPNKTSMEDAVKYLPLNYEDIIDASSRLDRFAPLIKKLFPETVDGIIESPLALGASFKTVLQNTYDKKINGRIFLKCDNHLHIAGSIKARGGIYEVLKYAEKLATENHLLSLDADYSKLANPEFRKLYSQYKIAVGSTGNLGLSIGIMSAALGFKVDVHMSNDAKEWKKRILRERGVNVIEYDDDYSRAVEEGRKECEKDLKAFFIDDENSKDLFLGYSVAALRLKKQLEKEQVTVDKDHPLYVYLPCGVGGAPGGITFGLKHLYGDNVHCYYVEPTHAPCMTLGLVTGKFNNASVKDYGIDNITEADGLAVGTPSNLVAEMSDKLIDGIYTIEDFELFKLLRLLKDSENIKIEPSAAASLLGPVVVNTHTNATHICWLTGGLLLPQEEYIKMYIKGTI